MRTAATQEKSPWERRLGGRITSLVLTSGSVRPTGPHSTSALWPQPTPSAAFFLEVQHAAHLQSS